MSAKLDNTRINRDINNYIQEIIQQLMEADGTFVELKLEVKGEVNTEAKAKGWVSAQCPKCKKFFIGDLDNLRTERSTACCRQEHRA